MTIALDIQNVSKTFGGGKSLFRLPKPTVQAVRNINLTVETGETVGIVGESGCGKTTLARMVVGLLEPSEGTITIAGQHILASGKTARGLNRHIQYVFQDSIASLNPRRTIRQTLEAPMIHLAEMDESSRQARLKELVDAVNLRPEFLDRYPHEFSGGQAQRIAIARALSAKPDILVLDEPVSALDVSVQAQVLNLLAELKKHLNLTYILISHDLAVIESTSDRVAVMYFGSIVEEAGSEIIFSQPAHPYTKLLADSAPALQQPISRLEANTIELPDPFNPPAGCPFVARCTRSTPDCNTSLPVLKPLEHVEIANHRGPHHHAACFNRLD